MALVLDGTTGIVSANIADGTISASDLASGAITSAALPAGSVIQVVHNYSASTFNTTGGDTLSTSITPLKASSKIVITAMVNYLVNPGSNAWAYVYLNRNGGNLTSAGGSINSAVMHEQGVPVIYTDTPNTTSTLTYVLGVGRGSGGTTSMDHYKSSIVIMEVSA